MAEAPSVWKRFWSHFDWLDGVDVLLYGGLGLALLGYTIYSIAGTLPSAGQIPALGMLVLVRDLWRRELTLPSRLFAGAWGLCVALVILIDLIESLS